MKIAPLQTGIARQSNDEPLAGVSENPNASAAPARSTP
jgi:hypothetical protein